MPLSQQKPTSPIEQLLDFHKSFDAEKQAKKELCPDHGLRKTSFCLECKLYICDKCLPLSKHSAHPTKHLSIMAFQVFESVSKEFKNFEENLFRIKQIKPQDWQVTLRDKLIKFFDSIQDKLQQIKQFSLKQMNAILKSMNFPALQRDIQDLEECHPLIKSNFEALKSAFESNHFS